MGREDPCIGPRRLGAALFGGSKSCAELMSGRRSQEEGRGEPSQPHHGRPCDRGSQGARLKPLRQVGGSWCRGEGRGRGERRSDRWGAVGSKGGRGRGERRSDRRQRVVPKVRRVDWRVAGAFFHRMGLPLILSERLEARPQRVPGNQRPLSCRNGFRRDTNGCPASNAPLPCRSGFRRDPALAAPQKPPLPPVRAAFAATSAVAGAHFAPWFA